jgi:hypothetical protein
MILSLRSRKKKCGEVDSMPYGNKSYAKKSQFDEKLDELLWSAKTEPGALPRDNRMVLEVSSYNGGIPKVQFGREAADGTKLKTGRLTAQELRLLQPMIDQACVKIETEFGETEMRNKPIWKTPESMNPDER